MKNFKLTICEAFIERLVNLASLEENARFQDVYLDALRDAVEDRTRLRRSTAGRDVPACANCMSGCCVRHA